MEIPGFIDLQVNGFKGIDFSSPSLTEDDFITACQNLFSEGTVAFLPTIITSPVELYKHNLPLMARVMDRLEFKGRLLGFHIEGPFISPNAGARGAHNPDWIRKPDIDLFKRMQEWADGKIKILTIAAEVKGAETLAEYAASLGITVSLGHQEATEAEVEKLVRSGARALTHLGNGVPNLLPRHHNPIWAGLAADELMALVITDGHHVPASLLKIFLRVKGASRIVVISDASPIAGLKPGRYQYIGSEVILEESGLLHDPQKKCLAGSSATMLKCMNYLSSLNFLSYDELLQVGFYNPLKLINIDPGLIPREKRVNFDSKSYRFVLGSFLQANTGNQHKYQNPHSTLIKF